MFATAVLLFTWAASDFRDLNRLSLRMLSFPAAIGTTLAVISIGLRMQRGGITQAREIVWRCAASMAAAGLAWPLSFGLAVLLQGDQQGALGAIAPALAGLLLGGIAGGAAGAAAARLFFDR